MIVLRLTKSRTATLPAVTLVSVPGQRWSVSQVVPLIVAEEKRPTVRNAPLPEPQRWRTERFGPPRFFAIWAFGARGQPLKLPPVSCMLAIAVVVLRWRILNRPW